MLIVLGGLPGAGKTTGARALAERLKAVHVRVDTIEQALRSCDVLKAEEEQCETRALHRGHKEVWE